MKYHLQTPLRSPADDHSSEGGGAPDVATALATLEDRTLPMSQRLSVAMAAMRGIDPTNQLASIQEQLTTAQTALTDKQAELAQLQSELESANAQIAALTTDVTDAQAATAAAEARAKAAEANEQDIAKRVDARVKEELASKGFPSSKLPSSSDEIQAELPANKAELEEQLGKLKTANERRALLQAFRTAHGTGLN
jgi:predicted  nucleic acid-binding Zn-ribbon protein